MPGVGDPFWLWTSLACFAFAFWWEARHQARHRAGIREESERIRRAHEGAALHKWHMHYYYGCDPLGRALWCEPGCKVYASRVPEPDNDPVRMRERAYERACAVAATLTTTEEA